VVTVSPGKVLDMQILKVDLLNQSLWAVGPIKYFVFVVLFLFGTLLAIELWASHLLGRYSTTWAIPLALFALVIFEIGCHVYTWAGLDYDPPSF
jgi:uncharacterized membrane protein (DUF485 family)